jgi:hypothetical protein
VGVIYCSLRHSLHQLRELLVLLAAPHTQAADTRWSAYQALRSNPLGRWRAASARRGARHPLPGNKLTQPSRLFHCVPVVVCPVKSRYRVRGAPGRLRGGIDCGVDSGHLGAVLRMPQGSVPGPTVARRSFMPCQSEMRTIPCPGST